MSALSAGEPGEWSVDESLQTKTASKQRAVSALVK